MTDKIKSMIKKMTFRLLVEQKDKYEHELWCDMETGMITETWDDKPGKEVLLTVKVMGAETSIKLLVKQITEQQTKVDQITDVKTMPKVTLALRCVMSLSRQYFIIYAVLTFAWTDNQFTNNAHLGVQEILETACTTVIDAPMLCVLFLVTLRRAIQLTQDKTEKNQMPHPWVQMSMAAVCTPCQAR